MFLNKIYSTILIIIVFSFIVKAETFNNNTKSDTNNISPTSETTKKTESQWEFVKSFKESQVPLINDKGDFILNKYGSGEYFIKSVIDPKKEISLEMFENFWPEEFHYINPEGNMVCGVIEKEELEENESEKTYVIWEDGKIAKSEISKDLQGNLKVAINSSSNQKKEIDLYQDKGQNGRVLFFDKNRNTTIFYNKNTKKLFIQQNNKRDVFSLNNEVKKSEDFEILGFSFIPREIPLTDKNGNILKDNKGYIESVLSITNILKSGSSRSEAVSYLIGSNIAPDRLIGNFIHEDKSTSAFILEQDENNNYKFNDLEKKSAIGSYATCTSLDGKIIGGRVNISESESQAVLWQENSIFKLPNKFSEVVAISPSGKYIVVIDHSWNAYIFCNTFLK